MSKTGVDVVHRSHLRIDKKLRKRYGIDTMLKIKLKKQTKDNVRKVFDFASKATDTYFLVRNLKNKPSKSDLIAAGFKLGDIASKFIDIECEEEERECISTICLEIFLDKHNIEDDNYSDFGCGSDIQHLLIKYIVDFYGKTLMNDKKAISDKLTEEHNNKVREIYDCFETMVEDIPVYWYVDITDKEHFGPFVENEKFDKLLDIIGKKVWGRLKTNNVSAVRDKKENTFNIIEDELAQDTLSSDVAENYSKRIAKFINFEEGAIHRALLFYGRPGTGKSTILRKIAQILELKTLRISFSDINNDIQSTLMPMIKILKPGVLIMDDVDRGHGNDALITLVEQFKKHIKVILASANHTSMMSDAVLRPGRFDEVVEIDTLDMNVIEKLIGEGVEDIHKEILQKLPIVYVDEFQKLRKVLGDSAAISEIAKFENRITLGKNPDSEKIDPIKFFKFLQKESSPPPRMQDYRDYDPDDDDDEY